MRRIGLIVNPVAGLGGRVGLKGSDGAEIQRRARELGAQPQAHQRAAGALQVLLPYRDQFELLAPPGEMGAALARQMGFAPLVVGSAAEVTTAEDTRQAARLMVAGGAGLILFAGGDGTARDILAAVENKIPALGIPAGVKIHSAVFAISPRTAGELAADYLLQPAPRLHEAEVIDLDEATYRAGRVITRLYGYMTVPYRRGRVQNQKVPTPASMAAQAEAIAAEVAEGLRPGWLYILGPGTTTRAVANRLGFPKTLVGVDVMNDTGLVALDVNEANLLALTAQLPARIIVTPVGGQGFIFGRGNQQISPAVIRRVGRENLIVVSLAEKINALQGSPLLVDSGDPQVDQVVAGYLPIITGYHEKTIYRVAAMDE